VVTPDRGDASEDSVSVVPTGVRAKSGAGGWYQDTATDLLLGEDGSEGA